MTHYPPPELFGVKANSATAPFQNDAPLEAAVKAVECAIIAQIVNATRPMQPDDRAQAVPLLVGDVFRGVRECFAGMDLPDDQENIAAACARSLCTAAIKGLVESAGSLASAKTALSKAVAFRCELREDALHALQSSVPAQKNATSPLQIAGTKAKIVLLAGLIEVFAGSARLTPNNVRREFFLGAIYALRAASAAALPDLATISAAEITGRIFVLGQLSKSVSCSLLASQLRGQGTVIMDVRYLTDEIMFAWRIASNMAELQQPNRQTGFAEHRADGKPTAAQNKPANERPKVGTPSPASVRQHEPAPSSSSQAGGLYQHREQSVPTHPASLENTAGSPARSPRSPFGAFGNLH